MAKLILDVTNPDVFEILLFAFAQSKQWLFSGGFMFEVVYKFGMLQVIDLRFTSQLAFLLFWGSMSNKVFLETNCQDFLFFGTSKLRDHPKGTETHLRKMDSMSCWFEAQRAIIEVYLDSAHEERNENRAAGNKRGGGHTSKG